MDAWSCYFIALIPLIAAAILWFKCKQFAWWEASIMVVLGLLTAGIFNYCAVKGMTSDIETWSGKVTTARWQPPWQEYYEYAVYRTEIYTTIDSKGNSHLHTRQVFDHWQPTSCWHGDYWDSQDTVNGKLTIDKNRYDDICTKFGKIQPSQGVRTTGEHNSRMIGGNPNDYYAININNHIYPTTSIRNWENKVKAAPSIFSYSPVPPTIKVFEYPKNDDRFTSDRVLGPTGITTYAWDQLNAELGPTKFVNLILVNFGPGSEEQMAEYQEAKWVGGKKNDLIICCGGGTEVSKPTWVKVFGWTERELVKQNIQTIVLNNGLLPVIIPLIKQEVMNNYEIKDWSKFDYLTVEIPRYLWFWMIFAVLVVSGGWCAFGLLNGIDKEANENALLKLNKPRR